MITDKQFKKIYNRCDKCKVPLCTSNCPAGLSIPFLLQCYEHHKSSAQKYLYRTNPFSEICGYLCSSKYCQSTCVKNKEDGYPLQIKDLHKYFGQDFTPDYDTLIVNDYPDKHIRVIGAGVGGLSTAWFLANLGIKVDIYEKKSEIGGKLNIIPDHRLPKDVLEHNLDIFRNHPNISIHINEEILSEDIKDTDIITLVGVGTVPNKLNITGEEYIKDYDQFLSNPYLSERDNIAVIGGGNVAVDCALLARRFNCKTTLLVRRNFYDMKLEPNYLNDLYDNKVNIITNFTPLAINMGFDTYTIEGNLNDNKVELKGFTKIVSAIGDRNSKDTPKTIVECVHRAQEMVSILINSF